MQAMGFKNIETLAQLAVDNTKDARAMQTATRSNAPTTVYLVASASFGASTMTVTGILNALRMR